MIDMGPLGEVVSFEVKPDEEIIVVCFNTGIVMAVPMRMIETMLFNCDPEMGNVKKIISRADGGSGGDSSSGEGPGS